MDVATAALREAAMAESDDEEQGPYDYAWHTRPLPEEREDEERRSMPRGSAAGRAP